jgi:DNA-binding transcriptional ArsR family regulator
MAYQNLRPTHEPAATPTPNGFAALADPTRRRIFERLAAGAKPVGELAEGLPVSRPAVSQHLKVLKEAGLVVDRRVGNRSIYQVNPDGVAAMRASLEQFWKQALTAFKAAVEQPPGPRAHASQSQSQSKTPHRPKEVR